MNEQVTKKIYLAGGCFWGVEAFFSKVDGVVDTIAGYANGNKQNPTYEEVVSGTSGFAETVSVTYDPFVLNLEDILYSFFDIIDPTSLNRQGFDTGEQYRSGIYYINDDDLKIINKVTQDVQKKYDKPMVVEIKSLENFYPAEDYHQRYLDKNPGAYCHVDLSNVSKYKRPDDFVISKNLTPLQFNVTQNNATEPAFSSPYIDNFEKGIYVDIVSSEPLFSSSDKFKCDCGWPAFSSPIKRHFVKLRPDNSYGMERTEVRSAHANSHLGHIFYDGPNGTSRYCINGAALRFIPYDKMESQGYSEYRAFVK